MTESIAPGRQRRHENADELRLLLDAAVTVMQRNDYADAPVADILHEADLSTRSFYRHFESKDQLFCALCRREAEVADRRLSANVGAAANPLAALHAWIDGILTLGQHRATAACLEVFGSAGAMRAEGYVEETRHACALLMAPLLALLADGRADGTFPLTDADPAADAGLIWSVAWGAAGFSPSGPAPASRDEVRSFCERALGVAVGAAVGVGVGATS